MDPRDQQVLNTFQDKIGREMTGIVTKTIVFGSRAKGGGVKDSDLDIAVLVTSKTEKIREKLENIAYDVMWAFDFQPIISLKIFPEKQFTRLAAKGFSFYKSVQNEGITASLKIEHGKEFLALIKSILPK